MSTITSITYAIRHGTLGALLLRVIILICSFALLGWVGYTLWTEYRWYLYLSMISAMIFFYIAWRDLHKQ